MDDFYEKVFDVVFKDKLSEIAVVIEFNSFEDKLFTDAVDKLQKTLDSRSNLDVRLIGKNKFSKFKFDTKYIFQCVVAGEKESKNEYFKASLEVETLKKTRLEDWMFSDNKDIGLLDVNAADEYERLLRRDIGKAVLETVMVNDGCRTNFMAGIHGLELLSVSSVDELKVAADLLVE